jgi:hypothetical protein
MRVALAGPGDTADPWNCEDGRIFPLLLVYRPRPSQLFIVASCSRNICLRHLAIPSNDLSLKA